MSSAENKMGGWTPYNPLTPTDTKVFKEALAGFVGVTYNPKSVATQVVNGTNYRFKCDASVPPSEVIWEAIVEVYQPLNGQPHITGIVRI
jgi:hypothetical protein